MAPVTRTVSPWMLAWTFILLSLIAFWIFLARSLSMPAFTVTFCLSLSWLIFSGVAVRSRKRMSTPRLAILPSTMSVTFFS